MATKGLLKVLPLRNALSSANYMASCEAGEVFAVTTGSTERLIYAGMHLTSTGLATGTAWTMSINSATVCAFATPTTRFTFTAQTCAMGQILAPLAFPVASTEILFWRAKCNPTATTDQRLGVIWLSIQ